MEENRKKKKMMKSSKKSEIEFCNVCRLHHDQGPRHKYFPRHKDFLSAFLDRFRSKFADVRFFLRNPILLRPQEESQNRVWCVFCDHDIVELGSSFAWYVILFSFEPIQLLFLMYCISWKEKSRSNFIIISVWLLFLSSKAINHFASSDHLKNVKQFLWKHGPAMDCIDDFRISEADVAKVMHLKVVSCGHISCNL